MSAKLFRGIWSGSHLSRPVVVTIGNFDGVHLGHQTLIKKVVELKGSTGTGALLSFYPHPDVVLKKSVEVPRIDSLGGKLGKLGAFGIDLVLLRRFSSAFSHLDWREFLNKIIIEQLGTTALVIGPDARVGYRGAGDAAKIQEFLGSKGVSVHLLNFEQIDHSPISSGRIRELLGLGDIRSANRLIGGPFSYCSRVIRGEGRGQKIGFRTANLQPTAQITPKVGVYLTQVDWNGAQFRSVTNVGFRPTFGGTTQTIETHILDFNQQIYGHKLTVQFLDRIRAEQKFGSVNELKAQIQRDIDLARGAKLD